MKGLSVVGVAVLALTLVSQSAVAADLPAGGLTRQEVADWLGRHSLTPTIHNDSEGRSIVSSAVSGVNFDIYFLDCAGDRCAAIQYAAGWTPLAGGTPDHVNQWNRDHRNIRAYLDSHNNVFGEYDIDISPGGSWEQMDQGLNRWSNAVAAFKTFFVG